MERVAEWASRTGLPVQMHLAETHDEIAWSAREHNCSPVELVDRTGLLTLALIAAHVMYPTVSDLDLIAARGIGVAYNARSNGKAGRGIAPMVALRARGVRVGLATDGPMSGNTLDLFSQMAPASMFQKIATGTRASFPARDVVRMATIEAAQALGMEAQIGSLEPDKQADLIRIDLSDPRLHPIYDIWSMLVFATLPTDVRGTMVGGQWLMEDRVVSTIDVDKALADALQVAALFTDHIRKIDAAAL
jgi:5-methylthioadenosine/S-adenosylhomocysteine deaminase